MAFHPFLSRDQQSDLVHHWRTKLRLSETQINTRLTNLASPDPGLRTQWSFQYLHELIDTLSTKET